MKLLFSLILIVTSLNCLASGETLYEGEYSTTAGNYWVAMQPSLEASTPCTGITFLVDYTSPTGYSVVQYQWYINSVLVKTVPWSTNANIATLTMPEPVSLITCIITYTNGTQTITGTSNAFKIVSQDIGVFISQANEAVAGCSNSVAFSTSTFSGSYIFTPPATAYTVQWTPPSNWVRNTISSDGHNISYFPDAVTGGNIVAKVLINGCPYTESFTQFITRTTTPVPTFISPNKILCQTVVAGNYAINGVCGASNYTYTISGNSSCVFASNNLQTLTTTATNVNLTFPQTGFSVTLSVKANYPVNGSSLASVIGIDHGTPAPTNLRLSDITCPTYTFNCDYVSPYTYNWSYYNPSTHTQTNLIFTSGMAKIEFPSNGTYNVGVSRTNACGTSPVSFISGVNVTCSLGGTGHRIANSDKATNAISIEKDNFKQLIIYPNPVNDYFIVDIGNISPTTLSKSILTGIKKVNIYSELGTLLSSFNYSGVQKIRISSKNLSDGIYTVKVYDGLSEKAVKIVVNRK